MNYKITKENADSFAIEGRIGRGGGDGANTPISRVTAMIDGHRVKAVLFGYKNDGVLTTDGYDMAVWYGDEEGEIEV